MHEVTSEQMTRITKAQRYRRTQEQMGSQARGWVRGPASGQALTPSGPSDSAPVPSLGRLETAYLPSQ